MEKYETFVYIHHAVLSAACKGYNRHSKVGCNNQNGDLAYGRTREKGRASYH